MLGSCGSSWAIRRRGRLAYSARGRAVPVPSRSLMCYEASVRRTAQRYVKRRIKRLTSGQSVIAAVEAFLGLQRFAIRLGGTHHEPVNACVSLPNRAHIATMR